MDILQWDAQERINYFYWLIRLGLVETSSIYQVNYRLLDGSLEKDIFDLTQSKVGNPSDPFRVKRLIHRWGSRVGHPWRATHGGSLTEAIHGPD